MSAWTELSLAEQLNDIDEGEDLVDTNDASTTLEATATATTETTETADAEKHRRATMHSSFAQFNALDPGMYASTGRASTNSSNNSPLYQEETAFQEEAEEPKDEDEEESVSTEGMGSCGCNFCSEMDNTDIAEEMIIIEDSHNDDDDDTRDPSQQSPITSSTSDRRSDESLGIGRMENRAVQRGRVLLLLFLILITVGVVERVYAILRYKEREKFEEAFAADAEKVFDSMAHSSDTCLNAVDSLAFWMVSSARENNQTWPFTVLPGFAGKAAKTRILSRAVSLQQYQIVSETNRNEWERYSKSHEGWIQDVIEVERQDTTFRLREYKYVSDYSFTSWPTRSIWYGDLASGTITFPLRGTGPYAPTWQSYPLTTYQNIHSPYNFNALQHKTLGPGIEHVVREKRAVFGPVINFADSNDTDGMNIFQSWVSRHVDDDIDPDEPVFPILYPILDTASGVITEPTRKSKVVGVIAATFFWRSFLEDILPSSERGLTVFFNNTCGQSFTYSVSGDRANYVGEGDHHEPIFYQPSRTQDGTEKMLAIRTFESLLDIADGHGHHGHHGMHQENYAGLPVDTAYCANTVTIFPCASTIDHFSTNSPRNHAILFASIFVVTALIFLAYDCFVAMRQRAVMKTAIQSSTIVSSLFPHSVRERLMEDSNGVLNHNVLSNYVQNPSDRVCDGDPKSVHRPTKLVLRSFLNNGEVDSHPEVMATKHNKPIADLFPDTTVIIADIAGFTAWSSVREPTQVFTLLETVYGAFDEIATRRKVFKVETIGDSYVAVVGLPDARPNHAVVMAKFAFDCRAQFNDLCSILEGSLGPETGELKLRIGLHSGPVTAGVLRGPKSRFQLFGDTVNMASRMESTGSANKIQVTQDTAKLLQEARKGHWLQSREENVDVKGKGVMTTFWIEPKRTSVCSSRTASQTSSIKLLISEPCTPPASFSMKHPILDSQTERLIKWNVAVLERLLKKIALRRIALGKKADPTVNWNKPHEGIVLNEVKEVIKLPDYNSKYIDHAEDPDSVILEKEVKSQLLQFVTAIACTYHGGNPFHNFSHASHVGMSVSKLLSRIVAPDKAFEKNEQLHDHTYGITSDPLTQFACVFSALIHDADHPGVPNSQLAKEDTRISKIYKGKSTAEQNSINLSWEILVQPDYSNLRKAIAQTQQEEERFRQLVVNAVCATDIIDKGLKNQRNQRWKKAFAQSAPASIWATPTEVRKQINRKATIVIEHIMQASDIAHTMQHWHIYVKWNERLYAELYKAYTEGRAETDPTDGWYEGEIGFFDFYIIPLAEKLSECGVFGVSSDEYLNYARMNRQEWEKKGHEMVASYVEKYKESYEENHEDYIETCKKPYRDHSDDNYDDTKSVPTLSPLERKRSASSSKRVGSTT